MCHGFFNDAVSKHCEHLEEVISVLGFIEDGVDWGAGAV